MGNDITVCIVGGVHVNIVGLPVEADMNTDVMMCFGDIARAALWKGLSGSNDATGWMQK